MNGVNSILKNENFRQTKPIVFPNPFIDNINVKVQDQLKSIEIFDLLGRKIADPNFNNDNGNYLIDLYKIKDKGTYIMKLITMNNHVISIKIMKLYV